MKERYHNSFFRKTVLHIIIPLILFGIVMLFYCARQMEKGIYLETAEGLEKKCELLLAVYDEFYPGDYSVILSEDGRKLLQKGDSLINEEFSLVDSIKERTGLDFTIFYGNERMISTIRNNDGSRNLYTFCTAQVEEEVLAGQKTAFYKNVGIGSGDYFASYSPLYHSDGTCIGIVFAGQPMERMDEELRQAVTPILLILALAILVTGWFSTHFIMGIVNALDKTERFLSRVSEGNLTENMPENVLRRNDELGNMACSAVHMQQSLKELVERDLLTGLYNRRHGTFLFQRIQKEFEEKNYVFSAAMCDIDFFKQVNDTFGHDAGDLVLKRVAEILQTNMDGKGYAVRWGGEEFLLLFPCMDIMAAEVLAEKVLHEVSELKIPYGTATITLTMTFGIAQAEQGEGSDAIIKHADRNMYKGKAHGRNQIVK